MVFYPPKPRKRGYYKKKGKNGMPRYKSAKPYAASVLQAVARRAVLKELNKKSETKNSCFTKTDGLEIFHNNFVECDGNLVKTTQGIASGEATDTGNRIGDKIWIKGVAIKMMVELNERYSDVTFRLLVLRCGRNDTPSRATLFNGLSGNKMLDTINTERYSILFQKYFKIKAPNPVAVSTDGTSSTIVNTVNNAGIFVGNTNQALSRSTKIVKAWIPGAKIAKGGVLTYEDGTENPKFFDYKVVLYAYSNYSTSQDLWYVGRLNDYIAVMYYKDF